MVEIFNNFIDGSFVAPQKKQYIDVDFTGYRVFKSGDIKKTV